ncbi:MAG: glycosyltransferase family 4 protein [Labilithrix sp.]|nr:glycosyltransferase family 4 protein [Labilithrix sp.]
MSVVHVVSAGEVGGAERMLVDLAAPRATATRAHSVALFTPSDALRALFRDAGLDVDDRGPVREGPLPYLASALGPGDVRWLSGVLERRRATVVHLHTFASQVLGTRAARRAGARVVRTEHSTRVYDDPSCWPFSRWSLRRADAVVFISEHVRAVATARAGRLLAEGAKTSLVYNGVDTARFAPRARGPAPASDERRPVRFVALGRLDRRKGLDLALRALAEVPDAELDVVGAGDERASLEALAGRLGLSTRVRFAGHAGDVRDAIAASDLALSSARQEGLGVALLEAMAMERAVVALPTGGIPEIVRDGATGWLAAERSPEALARAMRSAIAAGAAERRRRGGAARARVVETFSLDAMRAGYEAVYARLERLVAERGASSPP